MRPPAWALAATATLLLTGCSPAPEGAQPTRKGARASVRPSSSYGTPPASTGGPPIAHASAGAVRTPKVLVVGIDGVRYDRLLEARIPFMREMMRQGTFETGLLSLPKHVKSVSGPGWVTVLTGVEPEKHGVYDNSFKGRKFNEYPDFLTRLEALRPTLSTVAVSAWRSLVDTGALSDLVDWHATGHKRQYARGVKDAIIVRRLAEILRTKQVDVAFLHLESVDSIAHKLGAVSHEYLDAIDQMDTHLGSLFAAIRARPRFAQEEWTVIVTTDHGHRDTGGHGGVSKQERKVFVLAAGPGIAKAEVRDGARLVDVAATVFAQLGLEAPKEMTGAPLSNKPINRAFGGASRTNN